MNIDLKVYTNQYYNKICGAKLESVLETIKRGANHCRLEIITLLVSGEKDSFREFETISTFIHQLNPNILLHLSCYFPRYKLGNKTIEIEFLKQAQTLMKQYLNYVYPGNVEGVDCNTYCLKCVSLLILRYRYRTSYHLIEEVCSQYKVSIPIKLK